MILLSQGMMPMSDDPDLKQNIANLQMKKIYDQSTYYTNFLEQLEQEGFELIIDFDDYSN
jgi:hypothetical protein